MKLNYKDENEYFMNNYCKFEKRVEELAFNQKINEITLEHLKKVLYIKI